MPEEEDITDNLFYLIEAAVQKPVDEIDPDDSLLDIGFSRETLLELAFSINKDEYFKPLGVGLIPDDVAECETVAELIDLVNCELNNETPAPRRKKQIPKR